MTTRKKSKKFSPETKERAVRLLKESVSEYPSEWAAMKSIAEKIGCNPETLRSWVRRAEVDAGERSGTTTQDKARILELEKEVRDLVHHSDRGVQYLSICYTERLAEAGIQASVGSVGSSYDNALAETINGLYKTEVIHREGPWRNVQAVELATLDWVHWYNHHRLLEPLGYVPPAEYEEAFYNRQVTQRWAA